MSKKSGLAGPTCKSRASRGKTGQPSVPQFFDISISLFVSGKNVSAKTQRFSSGICKADFALNLAEVVWALTDEFIFKVRGTKFDKRDESKLQAPETEKIFP